MNTLPDIKLDQTLTCDHANPSWIISAEFQAMCKDVSNRVYGMCLQCAVEDKSQGLCEHVAVTKGLVRRDPFFEL